MTDWTLIDSTQVDEGRWMCLWTRPMKRAGVTTTLHRLTVAGMPLMEAPASTGSARRLAELGLESVKGRAPRVLIGGLGFGYTLAEALDRLPSAATVVVSEIYEAVMRWNREHLYMLEGHRLGDGRVRVEIEDVADRVRNSREQWDAILLDVDNGPRHFHRKSNDWLYSPEGLTAVRHALVPDGMLAVWSGFDDAAFERRLMDARFVVARHGFETRDETAVIWRAQKKGGV